MVKFREKSKIIDGIEKRRCSKCCQYKTIDNFGIKRARYDGLNVQCKQCIKEQEKIRWAKYIQNPKNKRAISKYRQENKVKIALSNKLWKQKNRDIINSKTRLYRQKEYVKKRRAEYARLQRKTSTNHRILCNLRSRLYSAIKSYKCGLNKLERTKILLGCSIVELKLHIEKQFKDGMNWENYGKGGWHIDHIIPCDSFDLTILSEQQKCFHYSNLQPLWAKDNISKGNKTL